MACTLSAHGRPPSQLNSTRNECAVELDVDRCLVVLVVFSSSLPMLAEEQIGLGDNNIKAVMSSSIFRNMNGFKFK